MKAKKDQKADKTEKKQTSRTDGAMQVELLKGDLIEAPSYKLQLLGLAGVLILVALVVVVVKMFDNRNAAAATSVQLIEVQKQLGSLNSTVKNLKKKDADIRDSKNLINSIYNILKSRIYWPDVLEWIESSTLSNIYYTELSLDNAEDLTLGLSIRSQTIEDALLQIDVFKAAEDCVNEVEFSQFDVVEETIEIHNPDEESGSQESESEQFFTSTYIQYTLTIILNAGCFMSA